MLKKFVGLMAVGMLVLSLLGADDRAFIGTWKMNEAKSKFTNTPEGKDMTLVIMKEGDSINQSLTGTVGGKPLSQKWSVKSGGGPVSYSEGGPPSVVSAVSKVINNRTVETTTTMNGKQISVERTEVSADHKTMTAKESGMNEKGEKYSYVAVFERQ